LRVAVVKEGLFRVAVSWDPAEAEEETCGEKVVNEVDDTTDTFVNRPEKAERAAENVEESGGVREDEDGTRRQLEEVEEPEDHPVVFTIQRIENGVEVGAASISGVRMAVHDEKAAASRSARAGHGLRFPVTLLR
jgi:hypothetical protein